VTDEDLFVTDDPSHVTDSNPPNHAQRDGVTDVTDKSQDGPAGNGYKSASSEINYDWEAAWQRDDG
jgi:hypothetical protein